MKDKILVGVIIFLCVVILLGTVFGLLNGHRPSEELRNSDPSPASISSLNKHTTDKIAAYSDLGQIRSSTKENTTIIITPWLSYPENDTVFFEEISRKRLIIKSIIKNYFTNYSQKELFEMTEPKIKNDLLEEINNQFTLGKISAVYFSEYIFLQ
ncbi:MAG: hypothetical protein MJ182_00110 [Treponema sp.]|nr:hypothetical protein [Treponema sp.]